MSPSRHKVNDKRPSGKRSRWRTHRVRPATLPVFEQERPIVNIIFTTVGQSAVLPFAETVSDVRETLEQRFSRLRNEWQTETSHVSSLHKIVMHPAYQRIIGMGPSAVPMMLRDMKKSPEHWLWALNAITEQDPAPEGANFEQAVQAWIKWGEKKGIC
jgi:hypothetical protein